MAPALREQDPSKIALSVGGSVVRPDEWNAFVVQKLMKFVREKVENGKTIIAIVGGGGVARKRIEEAKESGVTNQQELDEIGIATTIENREFLVQLFSFRGIHVRFYEPRTSYDKPTVDLGGGDRPGHTTDYVAVQAAHDAGLTTLFNVSNKSGLHPVDAEGHLDETKIIPKITWDDYLKIAPEHKAGVNFPFDREAATLAKEYGMTVVLLGPNFEDVDRCLRGEEFVGTIIHP